MKRLAWKIFNFLHKYISAPRMICGVKNYDGKFLSSTRLSNTTSIIYATKLDLGDNVFIGHYNFIEASNHITIEEGCQITNFVSILTHSSHQSIRLYGKNYIKYNGRHHAYIEGPVFIGKYSFIGAHATIMPNSVIGKGSVVVAYSLVSGKFPDFAIIAGTPAQVVGDTRKKDQEYLQKYPELIEYYNEWAK